MCVLYICVYISVYNTCTLLSLKKYNVDVNLDAPDFG